MNMNLSHKNKGLFGSCDFVLSVAGLEQLPVADRAEIAFAGRSNVGKSSLLNALTGRKSLARTSNTPGRTRQLNFFDLGGQMYLVDMPGYGYAKVSKTEKRSWNKLIRDYLKFRPTLRCVFILIDSRHGLKDSDREIMKMLDEAAVAYRIILTKGDKIHENDMAAIIETIRREIKTNAAAFPDVLVTSAVKKGGIEELKNIISNL